MKQKIFAVLTITALLLGSAIVAKTAVSTIAGLAVAQSSTVWNSVKDAALGDALTNGILASQLYMFNGTTFDRARGDTTFGLDVDVTRLPGGGQTPADGFSNPSTFNGAWALNGVFNGTTWDRMRGSITNGVLTEKKTVGTSFYANDRANITTSSVNLAFGFTSRKVKVIASANNTADICIDWLGGTAVCPAANTAGDDRLKAGTALIIDDYAVTSLSVIAESGTQEVQVAAWN